MKAEKQLYLKADPDYIPMGRGMIANLLAKIGTGGLSSLYSSQLPKYNEELTDADPVRKALVERMRSKGIRMLTAKELARGNALEEERIRDMENAFYSPDLKGIYLGKNFKGNATLAHEIGHAEDPEFLTNLNYQGRVTGAMGGLATALLRPQKVARLSAILGSLGFGGTLASEISASTRGYKMLGEAGEEKFSKKLEAANGLPTYLLASLVPALTYKGRKFLGAFK